MGRSIKSVEEGSYQAISRRLFEGRKRPSTVMDLMVPSQGTYAGPTCCMVTWQTTISSRAHQLRCLIRCAAHATYRIKDLDPDRCFDQCREIAASASKHALSQGLPPCTRCPTAEYQHSGTSAALQWRTVMMFCFVLYSTGLAGLASLDWFEGENTWSMPGTFGPKAYLLYV
ncbi:hypothetical protein VTN77DRAFT_7274 [Rasamsonia byssochlamydoides]|uniref:uncharacterized protein n=1 Tax=Rasamsonia byssochlamydoides TaxID=89139 RepID=UPI003742979F